MQTQGINNAMGIRFYIWTTILDDLKLWPLADSLKWRYIQLLAVAEETERAGALPEVAGMAYRLRLPADQLAHELEQLAAAELIEPPTERRPYWYLSKFEQRQAALSSAQRQAQYRARLAEDAGGASAEETAAKPKRLEPETEREIEVAAWLRAAGISWNSTTAQLAAPDRLDVTPGYIKAHTTGVDTALAIIKMCQRLPAPQRKNGRYTPDDLRSENQVPAEYLDLVKR